MTDDILHGLIWLARCGVRLGGGALRAGHGFADGGYRPPRLPYVSVIGPLGITTEAERDPTRPESLAVQSPGYVAGRSLGGSVVPPAGALDLAFDGDASAVVPVDPAALVGQPIDDQVGAALAAAVQAAVRAAPYLDGEGGPIADPTRLAELGRVTCRWDRARQRLVLASGRRGVVQEVDRASPSSVRIGSSPLAAALGLDPPDLVVPGRLARHRLPAQTAVSVDVRLDLWAGSQRDLAGLVDAWARLAPTRGQVAVRPALLAVDGAKGAATLSLARVGEPATRWSLVLVEGREGFVDRLGDGALATTAGATHGGDHLRLDGTGTARLPVAPAPPVPQPWIAEHPAPRGVALSLGLTAEAGADDGDTATLVRLTHEGRTVLGLDLAWSRVSGDLVADLQATAETQVGGLFSTARTTWRLDPAALEAGGTLHVAVDAVPGRVLLWWNGTPQRLDDATATPVAPTVAPGTAAGGGDMDLVLGDAGGTAVPFRVDHLHLLSQPVGPLDPAQRTSPSPATRWLPGDRIALAPSEEGHRPSGPAFVANVVAVDGDLVHLDRPLEEDWPRAGTLVFQRTLFFHQRQLRRRDDIMNHLYRLSAEYRVSALLGDELARVTAPLVEVPVVELRDLGRVRFEAELAELAEGEAPETLHPPRPAQTAPGTTSTIRPSITARAAGGDPAPQP